MSANKRERTIEVPSTRWAAWLVAASAVVAPQLLGGATPATRAGLLVLAALISIVTAVTCARVPRSLGRVPWAVWGAAAAAAWTLLQAVPLPCALVDAAWGERRELAGKLLALGIDGAPACTLSRAPSATWSAFAWAVCLWAVLASSTALSRMGHRRLLASSILWSSLTMAAVALSHAIADADKVFGVHTPQEAKPGLLLAPLLNGNHLAALLALGLPAALWRLQTSSRSEQRIVWGGLSLGLCATILLTLSRGGILAALVSASVYLAAPKTPRSPRAIPQARRRAILALCGATGFGVLLLYGADLLAREFGDVASMRGKADSIWRFLVLAGEHPWLGVGRGALGDVSVPVGGSTAHAVYAENLLAHWFVEWGVPASLVILACIGASFVKLRPERGLSYATACGLGGLILHEFADFALELPGVAFTAAIALGTLLFSRASAIALDSVRHRLKQTLIAGAIAATGAVIATWTVQTTHSRASAHATLEGMLRNNSPSFPSSLAGALRRYPLDPVLYVQGAGYAVRTRSARAPQWLNLAMARAPLWTNPHVQASYWLESQGRITQAADELGIAMALDPVTITPIACELIKRHPSARLVWLAAPDNEQRQDIVEQLAHCITMPAGLDALLALAPEILSRYPQSLKARERLIGALAYQGHVDQAISTARELVALSPEYAPGVAALIGSLARAGQYQAAWEAYLKAPARVRRDRHVLRVTSEALVHLRKLDALREVLDRLQAQSENSEDDLNLAIIAGEAYAAAGDTGRALGVLQNAYRRHRVPTLLERAHQLAWDAELRDVALRMALELCHLGYREGAFCEGPPH